MEQHKAVFMGSKVRKLYKVEYYYNAKLIATYDGIEDKEICRVDLDNPPLKNGDYIYINQLNKKVYIKSTIRSTNNEIIYYTNHHFEIIEDEITKQSKEKAEQEIKEFEQRKIEEEIQRKEQERISNIKWYQFWR